MTGVDRTRQDGDSGEVCGRFYWSDGGNHCVCGQAPGHDGSHPTRQQRETVQQAGETWRVGSHYGVHVYAEDRPVATFHNADDAARAVRDHNAASPGAQGGDDEARERLAAVLALVDRMAQSTRPADEWAGELRRAAGSKR